MGGIIGYVGLSHLGMVSSIAAASKGFPVVAYDPDAELCTRLSDCELPVHEPGLDHLLANCQQRITFTADASQLGQCDLVVLAQDVPTTQENESDPSTLDGLVDSVVDHLRPTATLVVLSQVRPGYVRALSQRIHSREGHENTPVYCQVETLVFGRAV